MFETSDKSRSGSLNQHELQGFLKLYTMQKLKSIDVNERWKLDETFKAFAKKTFILHMGRDPIGKTDAMTWVDMKNFRRTCHHLIEELEHTIVTHGVEE